MIRALACLALIACSTRTGLYITVNTPAGVEIDQLTVSGTIDGEQAFAPGVVPDPPRTLAETESFNLFLPAALAARSLRVRVVGSLAGVEIAAGETSTTIVEGRVLELTITLSNDEAIPGAGCASAADDTACDDGAFCTVGDKCVSGVCLGTARDCGVPSVCTTRACDETIDQCTTTTATNGVTCDDGDGRACTVGLCTAGVCGSTNDEAICGASQVCSPLTYTTVSGCGVPPTTLTLTCPTSQLPGVDAACTINLVAGVTPVKGEAARIVCTTTAAPITLFSDTFDGLLATGWTGVTGPTAGFLSLGGNPALSFASSSAASWRGDIVVPISGLARVCVDFDIAQSGVDAGESVKWEAGFETPPMAAVLSQQYLLDFTNWNADGIHTSARGVCVTPSGGHTHARFRLTLTSNAAADVVFVDNVVVSGLAVDYATPPLLDETFAALPAPGSWTTVSGGGAINAGVLQVESATVVLTARFDTRACSVFDFDFDFGNQAGNADESLTVAVGPSGAPQPIATLSYGTTNGWGTPASTLLPWVGLHRLAPPTASTELRFTLAANGNNDFVLLDNVIARCADLPEPLALPITDNGDGSYGVAIRSLAPVQSSVTCTWASSDDPARASSAATAFRP